MKIIITMSLLLILSISCKKEPDIVDACSEQTYTEAYQEEFDAATAAAGVYGNDPTPENCESMKAAYQKYIDALEGWEDCARRTNQLTQWQASIDSARNTIDGIMCG